MSVKPPANDSVEAVALRRRAQEFWAMSNGTLTGDNRLNRLNRRLLGAARLYAAACPGEPIQAQLGAAYRAGFADAKGQAIAAVESCIGGSIGIVFHGLRHVFLKLRPRRVK